MAEGTMHQATCYCTCWHGPFHFRNTQTNKGVEEMIFLNIGLIIPFGAETLFIWEKNKLISTFFRYFLGFVYFVSGLFGVGRGWGGGSIPLHKRNFSVVALRTN